ncbi:aldehyde dehydrogenase family protein [Streptomyces thinghirensis]|nr:aldehyde dehydrogenase family protein [Streptomyces thinghirensis]
MTEPATGDRLGTVGLATAEDVGRAGGRPPRRSEWAATSPQRRAAVLRRAGDLFTEHAAEIEDWLVRRGRLGPVQGRLRGGARRRRVLEVRACRRTPRARCSPRRRARWSLARRRPAGVVSVIAPFNFPLILGLRSVAPALALGNAVLLSRIRARASGGGVVITRIFEEARLPAGVLHLLPGDGSSGPGGRRGSGGRVISFTGSTPVGQTIGEQAGRLLKRAHLELGGNNALVVLPGADVCKAASAGPSARTCSSGNLA